MIMTHLDNKKLGFIASETTEAQKAAAHLQARYKGCAPDEADIIIALGGDGIMLQSLHRFIDKSVPIFGMNCGSVGFLMNRFDENDLRIRLEKARRTIVHPLKMRVTDRTGKESEALAVNEVSLLRKNAQAAKLQLSVDARLRMDELICDGVLVATPAGSTAYNFSAHGPILPLDASLLALTPISAFRPRRWRGALLPDRAQIDITILEADKRPVNAVADHTEFRDVIDVSIVQDRTIALHMLFDHDHSLDERIVAEQFTP